MPDPGSPPCWAQRPLWARGVCAQGPEGVHLCAAHGRSWLAGGHYSRWPSGPIATRKHTFFYEKMSQGLIAYTAFKKQSRRDRPQTQANTSTRKDATSATDPGAGGGAQWLKQPRVTVRGDKLWAQDRSDPQQVLRGHSCPTTVKSCWGLTSLHHLKPRAVGPQFPVRTRNEDGSGWKNVNPAPHH